MPKTTDTDLKRKRRPRPVYESQGDWDSQSWFPPLELAALVASGVLDPGKHRSVLDVGCGVGTEAIFMARMGWGGRVYAIDSDADALDNARDRAREHRASVSFKQVEFSHRQGLPNRWPKRFAVVLDRLFINNFGGEESSADGRSEYFERMSELVEPGGLLVVRDRVGIDMAEQTFRRLLFSAIRDDDFFDADNAKRVFKRRGPIVRARFVGDDTDDPRRMDAMIPIRGLLAVLERKGRV